MPVIHRRSAPGVRGGTVQRKNRHAFTRRYPERTGEEITIDRRRPGEGFRHYLTVSDVRRFLGILPNWGELSRGLRAIVLATKGPGYLGWYGNGIVAVSAWYRELTGEWTIDFVDEHRTVLDRLGVRYELNNDDPMWMFCHFDERSIRGFQLMHILLHELGHHHDLMTTRSRRECARGEDYAENYANEFAEELWDAYFREFNW